MDRALTADESTAIGWASRGITQGLSHLLRDEDPELARWIEELVATLKSPRQTTLTGWNSFLDPGADSS
ncbi:hypothetical protein ABZ749_31565 [Micromonospora sp. NPDC047753]|uniref:hypothetical protein n=1 Tax=Micromonospora sp. NPDC047753 TaxID=3154817 RepID=UPI0033FF2A48